MALTLRDFQLELVTRVRSSFKSGKRSPLVVAPTGSGKTVLFSYFTQAVVRKGNRVLLLAHRAELLDQISATLNQFSVPHSFIAAGMPFNPASRVHVGSVMSVVRRLNKIAHPDVVIVDEAHHACAASWKKVMAAYSKAWKIGVTASPIRLSGEPLGDVFDDMLVGPSVRELIEKGYLSRYRIFAPSTIDTTGLKIRGGDFAANELAGRASCITGDAIKEYKKRAAGKRAIAFCVTVGHAKDVASQFAAAGFSSQCIDGSLPKQIRAGIVGMFKAGRIQVLTSCDLISEGFDLPSIEVGIMLRPTQSLGCYIQQAGRALRPYPGKDYAIICDHAGNTARHGLPCDDRQWSLDGKQPKPKSPVKCPSCYGYQSKPGVVCEYCGAPLRDEAAGAARGGRALPEHVEGELEEIDLAKRSRARFAEQSNATTYEQLVELGKARGYKANWAAHIWKARGKRYGRNNLE